MRKMRLFGCPIGRFFLGGYGVAIDALHVVVVKKDAAERLLDASQRRHPHGWLQLAFPYADHVPSQPTQLQAVGGIALAVAFDFLLPEGGVGLGQAEIAASLMPMPETAVDENSRAVAAEHDVGRARQRAHVFAVAESAGIQIVAHQRLRLGVAAAYLRHASVPLFGCHRVGHFA